MHGPEAFMQQVLDQLVDLRAFLEVRFDRVDARLDRVELRLDRVETRLDHVEVRLTSVEARLTGVETRLDRGANGNLRPFAQPFALRPSPFALRPSTSRLRRYAQDDRVAALRSG